MSAKRWTPREQRLVVIALMSIRPLAGAGAKEIAMATVDVLSTGATTDVVVATNNRTWCGVATFTDGALTTVQVTDVSRQCTA